ncbi:MAG: hypothetical protein QMD36_06000 [Candidatus Aenigmarchaeota archaeon]|nr:hypothetical protein [Candidatus Aenigmarchaeota archaeon]
MFKTPEDYVLSKLSNMGVLEQALYAYITCKGPSSPGDIHHWLKKGTSTRSKLKLDRITRTLSHLMREGLLISSINPKKYISLHNITDFMEIKGPCEYKEIASNFNIFLKYDSLTSPFTKFINNLCKEGILSKFKDGRGKREKPIFYLTSIPENAEKAKLKGVKYAEKVYKALTSPKNTKELSKVMGIGEKSVSKVMKKLEKKFDFIHHIDVLGSPKRYWLRKDSPKEEVEKLMNISEVSIIEKILSSLETPKSAREIAEETRLSRKTVDTRLERLMKRNEVYKVRINPNKYAGKNPSYWYRRTNTEKDRLNKFIALFKSTGLKEMGKLSEYFSSHPTLTQEMMEKELNLPHSRARIILGRLKKYGLINEERGILYATGAQGFCYLLKKTLKEEKERFFEPEKCRFFECENLRVYGFVSYDKARYLCERYSLVKDAQKFQDVKRMFT